MPRARSKLDALAEMLERTGDDPLRLDVVQRAQRFKRSWVDLAEALTKLRHSRAYEAWGYSDLQEYCSKELAIRWATVDKLLLSFATVSATRPRCSRATAWRATSRASMPSTSSAARSAATTNPGRSAGWMRRTKRIEELRSAVFDEGSSVRELRERFQPVLRPQASRRSARTRAQSTRAAAKLCELLPEVAGVTGARIGRTIAALEALMRDLDALLDVDAAKTAKAANRTARAPSSRARGSA